MKKFLPIGSVVLLNFVGLQDGESLEFLRRLNAMEG